MNLSDGYIEQERALDFIIAGKSEFVLNSSKTGENFKYAMTRKKSKDNEDKFIYFLNVIKNNSKTYAGVIWFNNKERMFTFSKGKTGNIDASDISIRSLIFVLNKLYNEQHVEYLSVYHVGKCGACGKKLTTPESILTGLGPVCAKAAGIERVKIKKM